jgi:DNA (cytosine-5)-methyltransferase 1
MASLKRLKGLSLFSNIGMAESLLSNVKVLVANEVDQNRCKFYKHIYLLSQVHLGNFSKIQIYLSSKKIGWRF